MSTPLEIDSSVPINLLYIYAHADKRFSNELDKHLNLLQQQGVITTWKSQDIAIDTDTDFPLDVQLDSMQIILLLISPEFIASSYCYGSEMEQILARYSAGTVAAISVLLRPTEWQETPLKFLPVLPSKERAISTWSYHDDAFVLVMNAIRDAIAELPHRAIADQTDIQPINEAEASTASASNVIVPVNVFCAYAARDQKLCDKLALHLHILTKQGYINAIYYRVVGRPADEEDVIKQHLDQAQLILLLISADFLNDYLSETEMLHALRQHETGKARIILIILRSANWHFPPLDMLQVLPTGGKAITRWSNRDEAFLNVERGIRSVLSAPSSSQDSEEAEVHQQKTTEIMSIKLDRIGVGPINIFYSYAHQDEDLLQKFRRHMANLIRQGLVSESYDRQISAGTEWKEYLDTAISNAQIILVFMSPDYLASDYLYGLELQHALERQRAGEAVIIPIILRPVHWQSTPISRFQAFPPQGKPITSYTSLDLGFFEAAQALGKVVQSLLDQAIQRKKEQYLLDGSTYYNASRYDEALDAYREALNIDPENELILITVGRILLHLERFEEALETYKQALHLSSPSPSIYLFTGLILQRLGRSTEAFEAYSKAREHGYID